MGIDAGNGKDWETNAKSIQLIKQRGKVKMLDEEINSKYCESNIQLDFHSLVHFGY